MRRLGLIVVLLFLLIQVTFPAIAQTKKHVKEYFPVMNSQAAPGEITFRELISAEGLLAIGNGDTLTIVHCDFSIMQGGGNQSMDAFRVRSKNLPPDLIAFLRKLKSAKMIMFENVNARNADGQLLSIKARHIVVRQ